MNAHTELDKILARIIEAHNGVESQSTGSPHTRRDMGRAKAMYEAELAAAKKEAHDLIDRVAARAAVKDQDVCEDVFPSHFIKKS